MPITLNASTASGLVVTPDNSGQIAFQNNGTTELTVNAFGIGLGTAVPSSGTGITFPAVQDPSSNANTLDDYEEGTWTPNVGGNATYTIQLGTYVKVGRLVTVNFDMAINSIGTGSQTKIFGFPFTSSSNGFPRTGCVSYYETLSVSPVWLAFYVENNSTNISFVWNTVGSATVGNNGGNLLTNASRIIGSVSYNASA